MAAKKIIIELGHSIPDIPQIEVISVSSKTKGKRTRRVAKVVCHTCNKDPELWGNAEFEVSIYDLNRRALPCRCSKGPKYTQRQWKILLERAAVKCGIVFKRATEGKIDQKTRVEMYCPAHSLIWYPTAGSVLVGTSCPECAKIKRGASRSIKTDVMIDRFLSLGIFTEGTEFIRQEGRLWKVICPLCPGEEFISDRSNLLAGKRPCRCGNGGGFDKKLPASVYVLLIRDPRGGLFVGYGISNFLHRRLVGHKRELEKQGFKIIEESSIDMSGELALAIENDLKKMYPINPQDIPGFKREATFLEFYENVLDYLYLAEDF